MVVLHALSPGGTRPSLLQVAGLVLGLVGVGALVYPQALRAIFVGGAAPVIERVDPWGAGALVLASLSWSIGSLYSRRAAMPVSPLMATAMQMMCGGGLQLLAGCLLAEPGRLDPSHITWRSWLAFAYLIIFGSWIGYSAYTWLLRVTTPANVATYAYVNPVVAVLLGWLVLSERLTATTIFAMVLIVTAVVLITTAGPRRAKA
jgi:drug/metabolite transporter (DMT)-like permease